MRNTSAYVKFSSLVVLIGILYWRDFVALLQPVLSFEGIAALMEILYRGAFVELLQVILSNEWIGFALSIISLVFLSLYQGRKALKSLMLISENNNKQGAIFLGSAIALYTIGSYTSWVLWLHWCSLILFVIAYIMLRLDFRIPRMLFVPFMALLFVVPPPIENGLIGAWSSSSLIAFMVVAFFLAYTLKTSIFGRAKGVKPCPLCQSDKMKGAFCPHCGRQRSPPKPASTRFTITKFFVLLLIVSVVAFVFIPAFSFTDERSAMAFYAPHGKEDQSILQTPPGWVLETSIRQTSYERERFEDFVILNTYSSEKYAENKSYILLEIGSQRPYMWGIWQLPGWERYWENVPVTGGVMGTHVILQRQNETITVLCWTMPLLFKADAGYQTKQIGVSIYMKFTEPISAHLPEILTEFRRMSVSIIESWKPMSRWTLHASTLSEIYVRYKDFFLTALSVMGIFLFAGWVKAKDEKTERLTENAFLLLESEAPLLAAVSTMKKRKFTGAEAFEAYNSLNKTKVDVNRFYEKLNTLLKCNLLKRGYVLKNRELMMTWERTFP